MMQKTGISSAFLTESSSISLKATGFAENVMVTFTGIGEREYTGKGLGASQELERERTFSVLTVMTLMSQNLKR
jgi:hypothetical protein